MIGMLIGGLILFGFGGLLLMLFLGARRIEEELTESAGGARVKRANVAPIPRSFVFREPADPSPGRPEEVLLRQLQRYLDAEQVLADEFVLQPSLESLYRDSGRRLTAP